MDTQDRVSPVMFGSFQSYFVPKIHDMLIRLDEEKIKDLIRNANPKSPEGLLFKLIEESGSVIVKNTSILKEKGNNFGVINSQAISKNPWSLPYYDFLTEKVDFIVWNTTNEDGLDYKIIVNDNQIVHLPKICYNCWNIRYLGQIEEINSIIVLENNNIRDTFYFNSDEDRELFKKMSYRVIEN